MTYVVILKDGSTLCFKNIRNVLDDRMPGLFILEDKDGDWYYIVKENISALFPEKYVDK